MVEAARAQGLSRASAFADLDNAIAALRATAKAGDIVLVKASRCMQFERIGMALRAGTPKLESAMVPQP
jgi:UDP-N-acetylmuramyl pentapeptide synthase